jgi:uncharacterized protein YjgD (DUF1641 family)
MELENHSEEEDFNKLLEDKRHKELLDALKDSSDSEDDFQKLLEDKRHKEIINVLKEILISLSKTDSETQFDASEIIREIATVKSALPSSIVNLGKLIENKLDELKTLNKEEKTN